MVAQKVRNPIAAPTPYKTGPRMQKPHNLDPWCLFVFSGKKGGVPFEASHKTLLVCSHQVVENCCQLGHTNHQIKIMVETKKEEEQMRRFRVTLCR